MSRRNLLKATAAGALALIASSWMQNALAADTIKVGILHSLSGTMAISETSLKGCWPSRKRPERSGPPMR